MPAIKVFVVDAHPMIRHGIAAMLAENESLELVGEAGDREQALRHAPPLKPHVVVVDVSTPELDGLGTLSALRPLLPRARFVALSAQGEAPAVRRALAAGAHGYVLKSASGPDLLQAIVTAHRVKAATSAADVANDDGGDHAAAAPGDDLTQRERELLSLMARGMSNLDISTTLSIALPTVKFHVTNILAKLQADNRTEAVLIALRHKLVNLGPVP